MLKRLDGVEKKFQLNDKFKKKRGKLQLPIFKKFLSFSTHFLQQQLQEFVGRMFLLKKIIKNKTESKNRLSQT